MALVALVYRPRPVHADPADIFEIGAPAIGAEAPKAAAVNDGDVSVSTQTGALQYGYPIRTSPGRHGMAPRVSLNYSSQGPIYGTLASGWSLSGIPMITEDTTRGRMWLEGSDAKAYKSSMSGDRPFIQVTEWAVEAGVLHQFRAQNDSAFTRYELMLPSIAFRWKAYTTDGVTRYFGDSDHVSCSILSDEYAPLTREVDSFGNEVNYYWTQYVPGECVISQITWGRNGSTLQDFAAVVFNYATPQQQIPACHGVAVGSQTSFRTGTLITTGASELDQIVVYAFPPGGTTANAVHTRRITLTYDSTNGACDGQHAPFRALASIQESAWGTAAPQVDLPAVTFSYGDANIQYSQSTGSSSCADAHLWGGPGGPGGNMNCTLSWGYRFATTVANPNPSAGKWPTVEAMLLDIDGDGLLDRVWSSPGSYCQATWQRNLGDHFGGTQTFTLPTWKWLAGSPGDGYGPSTNALNHESCSLNYQETAYSNYYLRTSCPYGEQPDPTTGICGNANDHGTDTHTWTCGGEPSNCPQTQVFAYRWVDVNNDGRVDLVASPVYGGMYNLEWGQTIEPSLFGGFPSCPSTSTPAPGTTPMVIGTYTMCGGMYPWFVFLNHGNGVFGLSPTNGSNPTPDQITYQPMPLESSNGESSITSFPVEQTQGVVDLDGDGYGDAVTAYNASTSGAWAIFRNDTSGKMVPPPAQAAGYSFASATTDSLSNSVYSLATGQPTDTQGVLDINGDGLPDHWSSTSCTSGPGPLCSANVEFNDGVQFRPTELVSTYAPGHEGFIHTNGYSQASLCKLRDAAGHSGNCTTAVATGGRTDVARVLDLDVDGRPDVVHLNQTASYSPSAYLNVGGQFSPTPTSYLGFGIQHWIVAWLYGTNQYTWESRSDMTDINGDGIPDEIAFSDPDVFNSNPNYLGNNGLVQVGLGYTSTLAANTPGQPPRLLATINNGRGSVTTATYAPTTNSSIVIQAPGQDGANRTMPHVQWVVASISTHDSLANTTALTSYVYRNPEVTQDPDTLRWAFRGFDEVDVTLPSLATRIDRYGFDVDWSGRLTERLMVPAPAEWAVQGVQEVRSIEQTTWEARGLFPLSNTPPVQYLVTSFHATVTDHFTCANGQTELNCLTSPAGRTHEITTLSGVSDIGSLTYKPWMYAPTSHRLQAAVSPADGDRQTDTSYVLVARDSEYRLLTSSSTKSVQNSGSLVMYAKTAHQFDSSLVVAVTDEVWIDAVDADRAVTRRAYDAYGNVVQRWKPQQNQADYPGDLTHDGQFASYTYDDRNLFVVTELSEAAGLQNVRQERDYTYEYGTGTKLETLGPNIAPCFTYVQQCPLAQGKEDHRIVVDGLGRMIQRYEGFMGTSGTSYINVEVELNSYDDGPAASVTHQAAIDGALSYAGQPVRYTQDKTELDGHGRPIRKTLLVNGTADGVTTYAYRDDGTLASVSVPDPTADDTSTVTYTYTFDSLARPLTIRRPDDSSPGYQSGVNMTYDGLTTVSSEVVGTAGGVAAVTQTLKDSFGRLSEVDEQTSSSGPTWARTTYEYAPDDNVYTVTDPENNTTTLFHDFAGRRTQITRPSSRTWLYGYDLNGNMTSEVVPGGSSPTDIRYLTTTAYDDLDRPTCKVLGSRGLSPTDVEYFGAYHERFKYDYGDNDTGRLYSWGSYAASGALVNFVAPNYNGQGQQEETTHYISGVAGSPPLSRITVHNHWLNGGVAGSYSFDGVGAGTQGVYTEQHYDARGMLNDVEIVPGSQPWNSIVNTRNVAGLVTRQVPTGQYGGTGTWPTIESDWHYDKLGRVTSQQVMQGTSTVVRQDLFYNGNDDPKQLDHYLGNNYKSFQYTFDQRHQLTQVNETTTGGVYFNAQYNYGAAGRFTGAVENSSLPPNSTVKPRNVNYQYASGANADPEEVVAISGTGVTATFAYDAAGNQTMRCAGGTIVNGVCTPPAGGSATETDYVYDGKDQLRRATKVVNGVTQGSEEYWYDVNGRRMISAKRDGTGTLTEMIWFIDEIEAHYDASFTVTHIYSHVALGAAVARVDHTADTQFVVEYQYHGLGGSTLAAVDQVTGATNASFSYAPFGEVIEATDSTGNEDLAAHRRRMNDKFVDDISNLSYYGARYYDTLTMTWTQGDPAYRVAPDSARSMPRRANLYMFSLNNPLRYVDVDGNDPVQYWMRNANVDPKNQEAVEVADLSFRGALAGGKISQLLSAIGKTGHASALTNTPIGDGQSNREVRVVLVDLKSKESRDRATNIIGGKNNTDARAAARSRMEAMMTHHNLARGDNNGEGNVLLIDVGALQDIINTWGKQFAFALMGGYVEPHEAGHMYDLYHNASNSPRSDDSDRPIWDMMNPDDLLDIDGLWYNFDGLSLGTKDKQWNLGNDANRLDLFREPLKDPE